MIASEKHIKINQTTIIFYSKKYFKLIRNRCFSEKQRNSDDCNYDYAYSFFGKDFKFNTLYWFNGLIEEDSVYIYA